MDWLGGVEVGIVALAAVAFHYLVFSKKWLERKQMPRAAGRWMTAGFVMACLLLIWLSDKGNHVDFRSIFPSLVLLTVWAYCVVTWFRPRRKQR
jgi:hypothetical protein